MIPREAKTLDELAALPCDHLDFEHYWFLLEEDTVTLVGQDAGEPAQDMITIPRRLFDKIVDWYSGAEAALQPCGHPLSAIVSSDEGTHYCAMCEEEGRNA